MRHNTSHIDRTPRPRQVVFSASGPYLFAWLPLHLFHCGSTSGTVCVRSAHQLPLGCSFQSMWPVVSLLWLMYRSCNSSVCRPSCGKRLFFLSEVQQQRLAWLHLTGSTRVYCSVVGKQSRHPGWRVSALLETLITFTTFSLDLFDSDTPLVVSVMKLTITGYSANTPSVALHNQRLF